MAGTEQPNPISIGTKLLPESPIFRRSLSITKATRAIYPVSSRIDRKKNKVTIVGRNPITLPIPLKIPSTTSDCSTGLTPDSEPDPAKMQEVIEYAKKYDIHTIFFEELASPKVAKTLAKEVDAVTAVLNPIEGLSEEDIEAGEDYFSVMRKNLEALRKALN